MSLLSPLLFSDATMIDEKSYMELRVVAASWGKHPFDWNGQRWDFAVKDRNGQIYAIASPGADYLIQWTPFVDPIASGISIATQAADPSLARPLARNRDEILAATALRLAVALDDGLKRVPARDQLLSSAQYCLTIKEFRETLDGPLADSPILFGPLCLIRGPHYTKSWQAYFDGIDLGPVFVNDENAVNSDRETVAMLRALGQIHEAAVKSISR